mgnify:FL=1
MKKTGTCNTYNIEEIRADFPLLRANPKLAYLDNSATSQRPECVLRAVTDFYEKSNANPLRGLYDLAQNATETYEAAREVVRDFLNAKSAEEIVFTRNATEALNLVAYSYGGMVLQPGDEILVSIMEHHSNLLPWQQAARRMGAVLKYVECDRDGQLTEEMFRAALTDRTRIAAVTHVSNVLGWKNDISAFARACHARNIALVVDGAQSVPHMPVDVQALGADFLAFSGHKLLSPMGIGVLYGKREHLMAMPPFLTGGEMIDSVSRYDASFAELPHKFEAGTVNAGGAVGLAAAITYIRNLGFDYIEGRENALTRLAMEELQKIPFVHILGSDQAAEHHGILSFTVEGVHPHDVAAILDAEQIAVRAGHHCAQPLHQYLGVMSSTRASIAFYNTEDEIRRLAGCLSEIRRKMGYAE